MAAGVLQAGRFGSAGQAIVSGSELIVIVRVAVIKCPHIVTLQVSVNVPSQAVYVPVITEVAVPLIVQGDDNPFV